MTKRRYGTGLRSCDSLVNGEIKLAQELHRPQFPLRLHGKEILNQTFLLIGLGRYQIVLCTYFSTQRNFEKERPCRGLEPRLRKVTVIVWYDGTQYPGQCRCFSIG
jgi:hypothetical protein